jgi:hypothetical protein
MMHTIEVAKESGSCMIFEGGTWNIDSCRLQCTRWAVLWCRCESEVEVKNSFLGGLSEGPGYCINCQDHAITHVDGCHLERSCGEFSAAIAVFHSVKVQVQNSALQVLLTFSCSALASPFYRLAPTVPAAHLFVGGFVISAGGMRTNV